MFRFYERDETQHGGKKWYVAEFFFAGDHSIQGLGDTPEAAKRALRRHLEAIHAKSEAALQRFRPKRNAQSRSTNDATHSSSPTSSEVSCEATQ